MFHRIFFLVAFVACLAALGNAAKCGAQESKPSSPSEIQIAPAKITDADTEEQRLLKQRYNAAVSDWSNRNALVRIGQITPGDPELASSMRRIATAGLELFERNEERLALLENCFQMAKFTQEKVRVQVESGRAPATELDQANYYRFDAELQLLREKKRALK